MSDYNEYGKFTERKNDCIRNSKVAIKKFQDMSEEYEKISNRCQIERSWVKKELEEIIHLSEQETKQKSVETCDEAKKIISNIESDDSLTDEEKEKRKNEEYERLERELFYIEKFPKLSEKEQEQKLDEELLIIDKIELEEKNYMKQQIKYAINMRVLILDRYMQKGYDRKEIYEAIKILMKMELENKEVEKYIKETLYEKLKSKPELFQLYIAHSEKNSVLTESPVSSTPELENPIPTTESENSDSTLEHENPTPMPEPEMPTILENSPKKTWKTYISLALGIGTGAAVFFTCGTVGVSVLAIAGGITKRLISKRRKKLIQKRLNGELPIEDTEEPKTKIQEAMKKLKSYFKSEEFCRDVTWFLNGSIYTGLSLNVASSIYNFASQGNVLQGTDVSNSKTSSITATDQTKLSSPVDGIKIGENVGDYNVSVGHDTASWATNGNYTEKLISEYVNGNSIFKQFRIVNPDGSLGAMVDTKGISLTDFCNNYGVDPSQIAVDVASKDGVSQAWVSAVELLQKVGGKTL